MLLTSVDHFPSHLPSKIPWSFLFSRCFVSDLYLDVLVYLFLRQVHILGLDFPEACFLVQAGLEISEKCCLCPSSVGV